LKFANCGRLIMDTLKKENTTDFEKDLLAMEEKYGIKFNKIIFTG